MRTPRLGIIAGSSLAFVLAAIAADAVGDETAPADAARRSSDVVCGPRCLQFLLKFFQPDLTPDLLDIVSKVQPDFEMGSSLGRLEQYLNSNGLQTLAIEPAANTAILWPYPVLLYLSVEDDDLGHYVILLPESDRATAIVWSGLTGRIRMPTWQLAERIGGAALLISPEPIKEDAVSFPATTDATLRKLGWLAILFASPLAALAWASTFHAFRPRMGLTIRPE